MNLNIILFLPNGEQTTLQAGDTLMINLLDRTVGFVREGTPLCTYNSAKKGAGDDKFIAHGDPDRNGVLGMLNHFGIIAEQIYVGGGRKLYRLYKACDLPEKKLGAG